MASQNISVYTTDRTLFFNFFFSRFLLQNLIDLAGSESSKTETTGLRRKEGSYINKSLLTLGTVGVTKFVCQCSS